MILLWVTFVGASATNFANVNNNGNANNNSASNSNGVRPDFTTAQIGHVPCAAMGKEKSSIQQKLLINANLDVIIYECNHYLQGELFL